MRLLVTRPAPKGDALARALEAAGIGAMVFPLVEIVNVNPPHESLLDCARRIDAAEPIAAIVFVSAAGVAPFFREVAVERIAPIPILSVGPATTSALTRLGVPDVIMPPLTGDDQLVEVGSGAQLLQLPELAQAAVRGGCVFVVGGVDDGGGATDDGDDMISPTLCAGLRERQAIVRQVVCYRRRAIDESKGEQLRCAVAETDGIVAYTGSALRIIARHVARDVLAEKTVFVIHPNIAKIAGEIGFCSIIESPASLAQMATTIANYYR